MWFIKCNLNALLFDHNKHIRTYYINLIINHDLFLFVSEASIIRISDLENCCAKFKNNEINRIVSDKLFWNCAFKFHTGERSLLKDKLKKVHVNSKQLHI